MNLVFREATGKHITSLVNLLADDDLGATREDTSIPLNQRYSDAFHSIEQDPNNELTVVESDGELVGMLQLTSDKQRPDAIKFYQSPGFQATHEGFKLKLGEE